MAETHLLQTFSPGALLTHLALSLQVHCIFQCCIETIACPLIELLVPSMGDSRFWVRVKAEGKLHQKHDISQGERLLRAIWYHEPGSIGFEQQKLTAPCIRKKGTNQILKNLKKRCNGVSGTNEMRGSHDLRTLHFSFCFSQRMCSILSIYKLVFSTSETLLGRNGAA